MTRRVLKQSKQDTQPIDTQSKSKRGCLIGSVAFLSVVIIAATIILWEVIPFFRPNTATATPVYSGSDLAIKTSKPTSHQTEDPSTENSVTSTPTTNIPTSIPSPDPFSTLYNCNMEISFVSGSLESKSTEFKVLGLDYFEDKDDKFDPGKGTGIFYQSDHYFIIHSAYVNGNILRPMQAEFIRKYLEYWGESGEKYIEGQMANLINSEVLWSCDGKLLFKTKIDSIVRLSHVATEDVWLNPGHLQSILFNTENKGADWLGEMEFTSDPHLYVGFCGWGPQSQGNARFTYYRYIIRFIIE
jgi:hypothetical protein